MQHNEDLKYICIYIFRENFYKNKIMGSGIYFFPSAYPVCNFSTVNTLLGTRQEEEGERRNSSSCSVMGAFLVAQQ